MDCETKKNSHDGIVVNGGNDGVLGSHANRNKLIIDTDPGIGQFLSFFIFFPFRWLEMNLACLVAY